MFRSAILAKLRSSSSLAAVVGSRIYPVGPPQSWVPIRDGPALAFMVEEDTPGTDLDGADGTSIAQLSLIALATMQKDCLKIGRILRQEWSGFSGIVAGTALDYVVSRGRSVDYIDPIAGSDRGYYAVTHEYEIGHEV